MAKKHFGRLLTLAAVVGAAAAGVSYFLQYKSFHKELDEDFHDFEDDFDEFDDTEKQDGAAARNYVSLNTERKSADSEEGPKAPSDTSSQEEKKESSPSQETVTVSEDGVPEETKKDETKEDEAVPGETVTVEELSE